MDPKGHDLAQVIVNRAQLFTAGGALPPSLPDPQRSIPRSVAPASRACIQDNRSRLAQLSTRHHRLLFRSIPTSVRTESQQTAANMALQTERASPSPINTNFTTPPHTGASSPSSLSAKRSRSPLSLDLTTLPPLTSPSPPSNTLLVTRLADPKIFHPASLATIREHLSAIAPLNSFSPLKSMQRIIVSFYDEESAVRVRQAIDGTAFAVDSVAKCYFGEPTPIGDAEKKYLERPDAGRLFFISPPPSPPVGWEMKTEDPPNKQVHAEDLASKLSRLTGRLSDEPMSPAEDKPTYTASDLSAIKTHHRAALSEDMGTPRSPASGSPKKMRSRSSTLIYDPKAHGDSPALPAVMLETEDDSDVELDDGPRITAHTPRPPVELMEH